MKPESVWDTSSAMLGFSEIVDVRSTLTRPWRHSRLRAGKKWGTQRWNCSQHLQVLRFSKKRKKKKEKRKKKWCLQSTFADHPFEKEKKWTVQVNGECLGHFECNARVLRDSGCDINIDTSLATLTAACGCLGHAALELQSTFAGPLFLNFTPNGAKNRRG